MNNTTQSQNSIETIENQSENIKNQTKKPTSLAPGFVIGLLAGLLTFFLIGTEQGKKVRSKLHEDVTELIDSVKKIDKESVLANPAVMMIKKVYAWLLEYADRSKLKNL